MKAKLTMGLLGIAVVAASLAAARPAHAADLCIQLSGVGCDLTGDLGFFRFMRWRTPKSPSQATPLHGRACGYGAVHGTAILDAGGFQLGAQVTFDCDAVPGELYLGWDDVAPGGLGSEVPYVYGSFGDFNYTTSCTGTIVDCSTEPGLER